MAKLDIRSIEEIISDQKEYVNRWKKKEFCTRSEESLIDLESPLAQVVTGVRRSGKSTLCLLALKRAGVPFGYVNFDDERLSQISAGQLNDVFASLQVISGPFDYLLLDEIQNVDGWHLFVNRLLRQGLHVIVTGSNAKLLSSDLATHLTGRCKEIQLLPFSFREFCEVKRIDTASVSTLATARKRAAFDQYLKTGGFPEVLKLRDAGTYTRDLVRFILQRDIEQRFSITYKAAFEEIANHLLNESPAVISTAALQEFGVKAAQTARNYADHLKEAFILLGLKKYSPKSRIRLTHEKVYAIDVSLMDQRENAFSGTNLDRRLETVVFLQLVRFCGPRGLDLSYLADRSNGCDFLVGQGSRVRQAIQVSYDVSAPKTRRRELRGLVKASQVARAENLLLLTDHEWGEEEVEGRKIKIRPAFEWLLDASAFESLLG